MRFVASFLCGLRHRVESFTVSITLPACFDALLAKAVSHRPNYRSLGFFVGHRRLRLPHLCPPMEWVRLAGMTTPASWGSHPHIPRHLPLHRSGRVRGPRWRGYPPPLPRSKDLPPCFHPLSGLSNSMTLSSISAGMGCLLRRSQLPSHLPTTLHTP